MRGCCHGVQSLTLTAAGSAAYRESSDGRYIVATFDMRGVAKEDIHVKMSFSQRNKPNILLTWASAEITEWEDGGVIYRERLEVICHRTIPLPERTQVRDVCVVEDTTS